MLHFGLRAKIEAELEERLKEGAGLQALSPEGMAGGAEEHCVLQVSGVSSPFGSTYFSVCCWCCWHRSLQTRESVPSEEQRRSALNPNPGLRVHLHGVLGWLSSSIPTLAAVSQTVSSWRAEDLSHLFL